MVTRNPDGVLRIEKSSLSGVVGLSGAKNSALRLLAASLLTEETLILRNYPQDLLDIQIHEEMLQILGKGITHSGEDEVAIAEVRPSSSTLSWSGRSIRNTLLILGALVARTGRGSVPLPGGCALGNRKHDLHIQVLEQLGATVWEDDGNLVAAASNGLRGAEIHLPLRSTGATENALITSSLASGTTRIWNPHLRPEIEDLISLLQKMGVAITVRGQESIEVSGSQVLSGATHDVIPDSLEGLTWAIGAAISGGNVEIKNFPVEDVRVALTHLESSGLKIFYGEDSVVVTGSECFPLEVSTGPHPGINSDVQPLLAVWAAHSRGTSKIVDLRFPGRYEYAKELARMGLAYTIDGQILSINGHGGNLRGASVRALDLRAGAAAMLAAFTASGVTEIHDAWQIERGYSNLEQKLDALGVTFERSGQT